jgi:hypothetical protein
LYRRGRSGRKIQAKEREHGNAAQNGLRYNCRFSEHLIRESRVHRETLRAALRIIQTAETLEQARIQLARMLNVFDKLEAKGIKGDAAVAEAEERLMITQAPKTSSADERPVRRRGPG